MSGIIWIIVVGFVAGIIARMLSPGPNNPVGLHPDHHPRHRRRVSGDLDRPDDRLLWHRAQGAGFITATIGALIVLFIWNRLVARGDDSGLE